MTIAAVPTGVAVLDVPHRGDVLVIKERVGHLTTRGRPMATTPRRVSVARVVLKCITPDRARARRPNGSRARRCPVAKPSWASSGLAWAWASFALPTIKSWKPISYATVAMHVACLRRRCMPSAVPSTTVTATC